jgi:pimeloyl-ACP methyl ester carboxylesterase
MREFVFIHGGRQGSWVWDEVVAALRERGEVRTLALDVPGCGTKRGRDVAGLSIPDVLDDLAGDIDRAGVEGAILVGHSQAGTLMPGLCKMRPGAIGQAAYVACCAPATGQTVGEMMGDGLHGQSADMVGWPVPRETSTADELFKAMFCNDMEAATEDAFWARLGRDDWPAACGGAYRDWRYDAHPATPATYIAAVEDASLPLPWQLRFAERLGAGRTVRIDAGHQVMQTKPAELAQILLAL